MEDAIDRQLATAKGLIHGESALSHPLVELGQVVSVNLNFCGVLLQRSCVFYRDACVWLVDQLLKARASIQLLLLL